jgi:hypothetical protein
MIVSFEEILDVLQFMVYGDNASPTKNFAFVARLLEMSLKNNYIEIN